MPEQQYVFPYVTSQQYNELLQADSKLKAANPDEWERRRKDAEHRLLYGCAVCGFRGILTKKQ